MKPRKLIKFYLSALFYFVIVSCGDGNDSTSLEPPAAPQNLTPIVSAQDSNIQEGAELSITANAQDSDGSIQSYVWTQVSGISLELLNANSQEVSFIAPAVVTDETIILSVNVTDDDGAAASTNVTVLITANILTVTLNGLVTDAPIANANISVNLGGQEFSAIADENGVYSIELAADDSFVTEIVTLVATGEGADSPIKLVSVLGDFASVNNLSGEDKILTKDEIFGVNVTNLTTATTSLMESANNNQPITSLDQFASALSDIDTSSILPFATAIKLVVDFSESNPTLALPDGVTDTFALVGDKDIVGAFIQTAQNNEPESFAQAQSDIFADVNIVQGSSVTNTSVVNAYYGANQLFDIFSGKMVINEDGSGYRSEFNRGHALNWTLADNGIDIDYGIDGWAQFRIFVILPGDNVTTEQVTFVTGTTISYLSQTETNALILVQDTSILSYPNGELPDSEPAVQTAIISVVFETGITNAFDVLQRDANYSFPILPQFNIPVIGDVSDGSHSVGAVDTVWNADGTLTYQLPTLATDLSTGEQELTSSWSIDSRGHLLTTINDRELDITFVVENGGKTPLVNVVSESVDAVTGDAITIAVTWPMLLEEATWTAESVVGIYEFVRRIPVPLSDSWIELDENGSGVRVSTNDTNNDGQLTNDEFTILPFYWDIIAENLIIRFGGGFFGIAPCDLGGFDNSSEACPVVLEEEIDLHQINENGEYFVRRSQRGELPLAFGGGFFFGSNFNELWVTKTVTRPAELPTSQTSTESSSFEISIEGLMTQIDKQHQLELF